MNILALSVFVGLLVLQGKMWVFNANEEIEGKKSTKIINAILLGCIIATLGYIKNRATFFCLGFLYCSYTLLLTYYIECKIKRTNNLNLKKDFKKAVIILLFCGAIFILLNQLLLHNN